YALHGFLGLKTDWKFFSSNNLMPIDLFEINPPKFGLKQWAVCFNAYVEKKPRRRNILMGYSLGGRLAMHVLLQNPTLWDSAILISAHPGLESLELKQKRHASDNAWALRFKSESWEPLMQAWNQQEVFKDSTIVQRVEHDFSRELLADTLIHWSLAHQDN